MAAIKQKFFNDVSPMADFITHCLKANPSNTNITGKDLMAAFKSWSELKNIMLCTYYLRFILA